MTRIAWLGLGAMGSRMAAVLLKAGYELTVWNRTPESSAPLVAAGARLARTPAEAAGAADIIFSMLTDDDAARAVWLAGDGALKGAKPDAVIVEASTVSPTWISELAAAAESAGVDLIDAPVAGSRPQAEAGQLIVMAGGEASVFELVRPVLSAMAADVIHVGPKGSGAVLKLAVNAFFAVQLAAMAELLGLLARNGVNRVVAAELLARFPVVAPPLAGAARMMAAGLAAPMFTIDLVAKDLAYASALAKPGDAPMSDAAHYVARQAILAGLGELNVSGLARLYLE
jgi:3-hydroxyisobutyrate dehydrogenase